ncbi:MAG TPA: Na-translocating system protein MpsC family protein [Solirubrobacteraceae bacterium]|nr:Na-translocating system protein MpsC family protein [Solirubrobacteraceae bacterium]
MFSEPCDQPIPGDPQRASNKQHVTPSTQPRARSLTADQTPLKGGELNAAITSALIGIHTRYLGRGPRSASTFHYGHVLVTLMHDVLTQAEKSLTETGQIDAVNHIRHLFQETMEADFREAVERLTGRKVLAFISGNHIDPDVAAELFILDAPL